MHALDFSLRVLAHIFRYFPADEPRSVGFYPRFILLILDLLVQILWDPVVEVIDSIHEITGFNQLECLLHEFVEAFIEGDLGDGV